MSKEMEKAVSSDMFRWLAGIAIAVGGALATGWMWSVQQSTSIGRTIGRVEAQQAIDSKSLDRIESRVANLDERMHGDLNSIQEDLRETNRALGEIETHLVVVENRLNMTHLGPKQ